MAQEQLQTTPPARITWYAMLALQAVPAHGNHASLAGLG